MMDSGVHVLAASWAAGLNARLPGMSKGTVQKACHHPQHTHCFRDIAGVASQQGADPVWTAKTPAPTAAQPYDNSPGGDQTSPNPTNNTSSSTAWLSGLHHEFQRSVHPHIKSAWDLAVGSDLRYKGTTINEAFSSSALERAAMAYVQELFKLAATDPVVGVMCVFGCV
jgi:hypothetical protein